MNCFPVPNGSISKDSTKSWFWLGYYSLHLQHVRLKMKNNKDSGGLNQLYTER